MYYIQIYLYTEYIFPYTDRYEYIHTYIHTYICMMSATPSQGPWRLWRANFYRYGYPAGAEAPYNLSAWSPTREGSFHVPKRFGVLVLDSEL